MASRLSAATSPLAFRVQLCPFGTETDSGFSINNTGSHQEAWCLATASQWKNSHKILTLYRHADYSTNEDYGKSAAPFRGKRPTPLLP